MRVFIGSSSEQKKLVEWVTYFISKEYRGVIEPLPWTKPWPGGSYTLEYLEWVVRNTDASILFWTPDDKTWYRSTTRNEPRDNLHFEAGLFFSSHGRKRVHLLVQEGTSAPTDILGLTVKPFSLPSTSTDYESTALARIFRDVCDSIIQDGPRQRPAADLEFLDGDSDFEPLLAYGAPFRDIMPQCIRRLAKKNDLNTVDILVAYRIGDIRLDLERLRQQSGARVRACFVDMWDKISLEMHLRKYGDEHRDGKYLQNSVKDSIVALIGNCEFSGQSVNITSTKETICSDYQIRLTNQRITYALYRLNDVMCVVPLDMKKEQTPSPWGWIISRETCPRTFINYVDQYEAMFAEANRVFQS